MNEMAFGRWLVEQFRKLGWHVTRIENTVSNGVPDVHVCADGSDRWFELKVADGLFTHAELRASQFKWHSDRVRAGGNAYVLILNKRTDKIALLESWRFVKVASLTIGDLKEFECPRKDFLKEFTKRYCVPTDDDIRGEQLDTTSGTPRVDA